MILAYLLSLTFTLVYGHIAATNRRAAVVMVPVLDICRVSRSSPSFRPWSSLFTRQGRRIFGDSIVEKIDPRGKKYYWIGGVDLGFENIPDSDLLAIHQKCVSITPILLDLTNYPQ